MLMRPPRKLLVLNRVCRVGDDEGHDLLVSDGVRHATTAHSATAGWLSKTRSTSLAATFSPERLIMSFERSTK